VTGPQHVRRRGGARVAATDDHDAHIRSYRAYIGVVMLAFGEKLAAGPADEREAAYRASVDELTTAWEENPEFGNALNLAVMTGVTGPLADYVETHRLTDAQSTTLGPWIRSLSRKRPGRQHGHVSSGIKEGPIKLEDTRRSTALDIPAAERGAAYLVGHLRVEWLKDHPDRERVPSREFKAMIDEATTLVATSFGVEKDRISESNIRIWLKTGRVGRRGT
jgi:hypothetical protein